MSLSAHEFWTTIHGMVLGAIFLLAFAGGLAALYGFRREWETTTGIKKEIRRLTAGTWIMAIVAWLTVITGTWIVYPWYRLKPPENADLRYYPRAYLLSSHTLEEWHNFGMEWKEHISWAAPVLATIVAYVVLKEGFRLADTPFIRNAMIVLFTLAFVAAGIAGLFGALITKVAPIL